MVSFFNFVDGANYGVSPFLVSQTELSELETASVSDELGLISKEPGYFIAGSAIPGRTDKSIFGFWTIYDPITQLTREYAVVNNAGNTDLELWSRESSIGSYTAWAEITAAEAAWTQHNRQVNFETFISKVFAVADLENPSGVIDGVSFSTTGLAANMPNAKYIKKYRDRLYVANCKKGSTNYPYRIYFSTIPAAGSITWEDVNFIDVDFQEEITGLEANFDRLLIFTATKTYIYDQENLKLGWQVGCPYGSLIASDSVNTVWANSYGVWATVQGGQPQNIGGKVLPFLEYTFLNQSSAASRPYSAAMVNGEYWLYIGSTPVPVKDKSYSNLALVFNFQTSGWRLRPFSSAKRAFYKFYDYFLNKDRLLMGSSIGTIWMYGTPRVDWYSPTADLKAITADSYVDANNNVPIASSFTLPPFKLESYDVQMYIDKIVPYVRNAGNLELTARILDNQSEALTEWFPIATLSKYQQEFSAKQIQGTLLQVRGSEIGKNTAWEFYGVEVLLSKSSDLKD
jgi:hypothetical protein